MTLDAEAMARLLEITGGDQGFVDELVDTFLEDATTQIASLHGAADADDVEAIVRPAHSLKSNAANVGATVLGELSRALETDARAGTVADLTERVARVDAEFGRVRDALLAERAGR